MTHQLQQDFFFESLTMTPDELCAFLSHKGNIAIDLTITRNRVNMISVSFDAVTRITLRLHEAYLAAPRPVLSALRSFLACRSAEDWRVVSTFASAITAPPSQQPKRQQRTKGNVYDLKQIRNEINRRFFQSRLRCKIGWGRHAAKRRRSRSIRFGSYRKDDNLVLINPRLDTYDVPREFIEYIVYHEMLHAAVPSVRRNDRWQHHPPAYKVLEKQFPNWARMQVLSKQLLHQNQV